MKIPMNKLVDLLDPDIEELHDSLLKTLMILAKDGKEKAVEKLFIAGNFFDVLQVTIIARYILHSTSSANTWRERKMLFNRVFGTKFCSIFPVLSDLSKMHTTS